MSETVNAGLPATAAYLPGVRGHAVLALGADADGREAIAVWRVDIGGAAVGAWVLPLDQRAGDGPDPAEVLTGMQGRALVGLTPDGPVAVLDKVAALLPLGLAGRLSTAVLVVADLVTEVVEQRAHYHRLNEEFRAGGKPNVLPLAWPTAVGNQVAGSRPRPSAASPVAEEALVVVGELRRAIDLWQDTEQVRARRAHLRELGDIQPLPPRWTDGLRAAAA